jgi:hypothetical protein
MSNSGAKRLNRRYAAVISSVCGYIIKMYQIKQIYDKYADEVSLFQYRNFYPTSTLNLNEENKKTTFKIDVEDDFIDKGIEYYIEGKITPTNAKNTFNSKSNIKMVDNFVAHKFPQIEVKKHGTIFYEIDFTGIANTVKGCLSYPGADEYKSKAVNSGLKTFALESQNFSVVGRLGDLGLGFFSDISVHIYKGGFEITFTRNNDNNIIYRWKGLKADGTEDSAFLPDEGKVTINNFYLRVPIIEYNNEVKINLIYNLFKENYNFQFKKWQCIQHMKINGKSLTFDITNIYRNVQNPIWAFGVFQTKRINNQQKDNSTFDHVDVGNLWLEVSGRRYPEESLNLNWDSDNYCLGYNPYQDYKRIFYKNSDSIPYIGLKSFKNRYPNYSIDLTDQPKRISDAKSNIILIKELSVISS